MKRFLVIIIVAITFIACEKKETPVNPAKSQALSAGMGSDYAKMMYFNVSTGLFVKEVEHLPYDLQFPNQSSDRHIYLNSSNFMFVKNMGVVNFESVADTIGGSEWLYDFPTGNENRTAIGNWMDENGASKNEVFIVDRGFKPDGFLIGFKKLQIIEATDLYYELRVANLDNTEDTVVTVFKDNNKSLTQFYFETNSVEDIEPFKTNWHLHFTQYTDYDITDDGDTIAYIVRGVLINKLNTAVASLEGLDFSEIELSDVQSLNYSSDRNAIGYDWKYFSLDTGIYEVDPDKIYIIREIGGNYYKLRFIDFYSDDGEKGYAKFEIVGL